MNAKEKKGLSELLGDLSTPDLIDIANLTNNSSKHDSSAKPTVVIEDIIKNAANSSEVLHRQKVSRDILFKYLKKNKVAVKDKGKRKHFISSCLNLWGVVEDSKVSGEKRETRSNRASVNKK